MKFNIKEWCLSIASLGPIGYLPFGAQIAALLAFPVLIALGWLYLLSVTLFSVIASTLGALAVLSIYVALTLETDQHPGIIVIHNLLGVLLTFTCVPVTIKFALIGILLFYGARYTIPLLARKLIGQSYEQWPLFVTMLGVNVFSGLAVNIFLQFVLWLARGV
jgi:hypothetical protein